MKEKQYYLYYHRDCNSNALIYVGVGYHKRAWTFKWGRNKHYINYINKHGIPKVELIYENLSEDKAYELEIQLIKQYGRKGIDENGILLNKSIGGKTSALGTKQHITQEWKDKIGNANRGKAKLSKGVIENIRRASSKKVYQKSLNGEIIKTWTSVVEISKVLNLNKNIIYSFLSGRTKTSPYGFLWEYVEGFNKGNNRPGKSIVQEDIYGNLIKEWSRISDAIRETKILGISAALKSGENVGGFKWKYKIK